MKMEQEHGWCKHVHVQHGDEMRGENGEVMCAKVEVYIEF